ncbi:hypothetical protein BDZ85DRAFT_262575 [Elsinoe ampelina]|uniref:Uncharacterized protein n=1 Tax=Elsinoe ampelina TaxID=302913 RepID=A0A6A6GB07_9PEZI|nr:hypothetical protein BDZ85DRAFT_262575 [Elsinoe ampelina]
MPLPRHLPNLKNKDLLIFTAAAEGNIDRYASLRRPWDPENRSEICAVVRGIYHHPFFAKWCSLQTEFLSVPAIQDAITARYIMCGDVSRVTAETTAYQIWYPVQAESDTYQEVLRRCPSMRQAVARAAIVINYTLLFSEAQPDPTDRFLYLEADASSNPWFKEELHRLATEQGKQVETRLREFDIEREICPLPIQQMREHFPHFPPKDLNADTYFGYSRVKMYDGHDYDFSRTAASVVTSDEVKNHRYFRKNARFNTSYTFPGAWDHIEDYEMAPSESSGDESEPEPDPNFFD